MIWNVKRFAVNWRLPCSTEIIHQKGQFKANQKVVIISLFTVYPIIFTGINRIFPTALSTASSKTPHE